MPTDPVREPQTPPAFVATVVCPEGRPVPLPPGVTGAVGRGRTAATAQSQARARFLNATGWTGHEAARLGFSVRVSKTAPEVAASA